MLFDKKLFTFVEQKITDWHEALKIGVNKLVENNYCDFELYNQIVKSVDQYGPYFVLIPQIALAHAEPGPWCKKIGISLTIFKNPVKFSSEKKDQVKVIFTLSAVDADSHLELLKEFVNVMYNHDLKEKLLSIDNESELIKVLFTGKN